jgi:hypothetical protein
MLLAGLLAPACALGLYEATLSYRAIIRLRTYESASETAAQYSQMAADKLWRTRTTQGAAAVSVRAPCSDDQCSSTMASQMQLLNRSS